MFRLAVEPQGTVERSADHRYLDITTSSYHILNYRYYSHWVQTTDLHPPQNYNNNSCYKVVIETFKYNIQTKLYNLAYKLGNR